MELIAVVMGCETSQERFAACKSMLDYGFANFALVSPRLETEITVPVTLGASDFAVAVEGASSALLIDKSQRDMITTEITLEETVTAPVSQGQRLGTMTVKAGEQVLTQVPLVAKEPVLRLTLGQLFLRVLRRIAMAAP